jgi:hypothetical protein
MPATAPPPSDSCPTPDADERRQDLLVERLTDLARELIGLLRSLVKWVLITAGALGVAGLGLIAALAGANLLIEGSREGLTVAGSKGPRLVQGGSSATAPVLEPWDGDGPDEGVTGASEGP